ncbi:MAG: PAS domain S-box protein, partial [Acidobacteria bacterium]|nr:PAS domain S-box protein [Acidobacteriota bacterium]
AVATASLVVAFLAVLGTLAARANYLRERALAFALAAAAADTEAREISRWFSDRFADAHMLREGALMADALVLLAEGRADARERRDVQEWLASLARHYPYENLTLTDSLGRVLLTHAAAGAAAVDQRAVDGVRIAADTGVVQFVDRDWAESQEDQPLSWVVPLGGVPAKAVLIMEADLEHTVHPALSVWLASSRSAEAMIVGRAGDRVFFLNKPRLAPGPIRPAFSTGDTMPLPARLAAGGQEGSVAAPDYRGVPVFAAVRQIAGTPWALITKVDQAEVAASANQVTLVVGVSLAASALAVILAVGLIWYRRDLRTTEYIDVLTKEQLRADDMVRTLSTAVAQSPLTIVITDLAGTISYVNPMFTQVTGYTREEAIGRNPSILRSGELPQEHYLQLWDTILGGNVWHGELHNKRKNGELFWEAATIAPLRDAAGRPSGFVALKREITAEKTAQEAHAQLQSEFAHAQKMESVGRLAGGVAHDFNNMLAVILGHAEMALESLDDASPLREHLVEILQAGQRSSDLTRQLLAFARKQKASPKVIDLNEEVTNTLKMLRRLIGENIALAWKPGEGLWRVLMDPAQVDQILANLSVNARDAITGHGTLTIETGNVTVSAKQARERPQLRPGEFVRLSIQDTGCGMPPEVLAHLFEPFFTTKAEGKGTGLGTATVYGIVTQNNGAIEVESAVGEGTTIRLYLPRAAQTATGDTGHTRNEVPRGTETILVVEDEAAMLSICTRMLEHLGYTVVGCPSAAQALAAAEVYPGTIHALLTDVVMPGMNGRALADAVALRYPGIRVMFMSGYTADVISQRGVIDEGVHFLPKPFSASQLAVKLRELFQ